MAIGLAHAQLHAVEKANTEYGSAQTLSRDRAAKLALKSGFELKMARPKHLGRDGLAGTVGANIAHERGIYVGVVFFRRILGRGEGLPSKAAAASRVVLRMPTRPPRLLQHSF